MPGGFLLPRPTRTASPRIHSPLRDWRRHAASAHRIASASRIPRT
ncbi:hypothetical protein DA2_1529 [Desulfovibrio sp. A2]|nr:hypothetical protein DA2_1529 [Desulfovibrio sp. A2]